METKKIESLAGTFVLPVSNLCIHCRTLVPRKRLSLNAEDAQFCCKGCQLVFSLLNVKGLTFYYQLRDQVADPHFKKPPTTLSDDYSALDSAEFREKIYTNSGSPTVRFYIEGVHCAACIWLIERLPQLSSSIEAASLDLSTSVATLRLTPAASLASVANSISSIGYRPHVLENSDSAELLQKIENRAWLMRIGVSGACAGNIMILAVSVYSGASGFTGRIFNGLSLALFLPVLFYGAAPFFRSAFAALKTKTLSIDVPIVMAILLAAVVSAVHTFQGSDHVYYDSISALVFLLLSTRYLLRRAQQKSLGDLRFFHFLTPAFATVRDPENGECKQVLASSVRVDDHLIIKQGELVPADGFLFKGTGYLNVSVMTGEPLPQRIKTGDKVLSGSKNEGDEIEIVVTASGVNSQLGQILKQLDAELSRKAPIVEAADRISKWFLLGVLLSAAAVLIFNADLSVGVNRALALLIVTCPCALALATPLTMSLALKRAAARGILIKKGETLEKLSRVKSIILDKTGTLTSGTFKVLSWTEHAKIPGLKEIVFELEKISKHPIAKALSAYSAETSECMLPGRRVVSGNKEILGRGVEGHIDNTFYEIRALESVDVKQGIFQSSVGVYRNRELVATIVLGDALKEDAKVAIEKLSRFQIPIFLLSGDRAEAVRQTAEQLGIIPANCAAQANPQQKMEFVLGQDNPLMVGDGANDVLALSSAYVSVAVQSSLETSLQASDVYLSRPAVSSIQELMVLGRSAMNIIYRNFVFSLGYNLLGGFAAATGYITPLFAALLMPLSALTVLSSSLIGARRFTQPSKESQ